MAQGAAKSALCPNVLGTAEGAKTREAVPWLLPFFSFILFFFHFKKLSCTPALCQDLRQMLGFSRETIRPLAQMHVYLQWGHMLTRKVPGSGCENGLQLVRGVWRQHPGGSDSQELRHESESQSRGGKGGTF